MKWTEQSVRGEPLTHLESAETTPKRSLLDGGVSRFTQDSAEQAQEQPASVAEENQVTADQHAYHLRAIVENGRRAVAELGTGENGGPQPELAVAEAQRQEFWMDTCREITRMRAASKLGINLYCQQGCRFCEPTRHQVQGILDALDLAMPFWDRDHPDLFYQTLELNFPELVRCR